MKRQRTTAGEGPAPQPRVPLQTELRRARRLDAAIESHEAALARLRSRSSTALEGAPSSPADARLRLEDDVERLKNELFDESVDQHQLQLVVDRLKLSWAAMGAVFPRPSSSRGSVSEHSVRCAASSSAGPENDRLQLELRRRDAKNDEALLLVKQLEAARAAARDAEDSCRGEGARRCRFA